METNIFKILEKCEIYKITYIPIRDNLELGKANEN